MGMGNASRRRGADTSYQRDDDVARYRVEAVPGAARDREVRPLISAVPLSALFCPCSQNSELAGVFFSASLSFQWYIASLFSISRVTVSKSATLPRSRLESASAC